MSSGSPFENFTSQIKEKTNHWGEIPTRNDVNDLQERLKEYQHFTKSKGKLNKIAKEKKINPEKCWAKLESGVQCKRKKKNGTSFCKEHIENCSLFGTIASQMNDSSNTLNKKEKEKEKEKKNIKTWIFYIYEVDGIEYFVDDGNKLYNTESILSDQLEPQIIGRINDQNEIIMDKLGG